jgi:hypothetical protein
MLTYAGVVSDDESVADMQGGYADVCGRMLTYAGVVSDDESVADMQGALSSCTHIQTKADTLRPR